MNASAMILSWKGVLVSRSVTTGPSDWIHGDLWHLPTGLLRVPLGLAATARHLTFRTVDPSNRLRDEWGEDEIADLVSSDDSVLWLPFVGTRSAHLYNRRLTSYIVIGLGEPGNQIRLSCFRRDGAVEYLAPVLRAVLGDNARVDGD
jgi:hypothetical protein